MRRRRGRPPDPRRSAHARRLGLAGWDVIPLLVLSNAGTAEFWTGDMVEAEKHLRAAVDANQWSGRAAAAPQRGGAPGPAAAERGDLDAAQADAQAAVQHATEAGWTVSAQVVAAYLALAWVALDRDEHRGRRRWLARVAEVEAIMPEPHVQLAAAALSALRRADVGDWDGALYRPAPATAGLTENAPPALADRLLLVEAELLRRIGDLREAADVLDPADVVRPPRRPPTGSPGCTSPRATPAQRSSRWPLPAGRPPRVSRWTATSCAP